MTNATRLWIIIPAHNESAYIEACLDSFLVQSDTEYNLVVVDNNSSDDTVKKIHDWQTRHKEVNCYVLHEKQQGIVWACKTGFGHAIKQGADILA
ncbi:MAG: glycosyltransferase family 2 protein, partial [Acidobacteriota bacterium]